jgi:2-(1,2-epoxy-1,2-dihydrophenyl)acetyl-CoA isomerase
VTPLNPLPEGVNVEEELVAKLENGVLWLTINRADKGNAVPYYVRDRLTQHFWDAHSDLNVRAIVLTAAGERHFCTGADLSVPQPAGKPKPDGAPAMVAGGATHMMRLGFQRLMEAMLDCEKPIVVALNGTAAGGGGMFVLAADLVIAADNAKLIQVFVRRGLVPDGGVAYLLPRIVGMHKAKELMFFGDDLSAADAATLGIVNKVVPATELPGAAKEWAERLAAGPTKAIGWGKKLLQDASELSRHDLLEEEAMMVELNSSTVDSQEGVASFRERRPPEWKGW